MFTQSVYFLHFAWRNVNKQRISNLAIRWNRMFTLNIVPVHTSRYFFVSSMTDSIAFNALYSTIYIQNEYIVIDKT